MTEGTETTNSAAPSRELTFGMKAVGLNFNPGGSSEVNVIKQMCAALIDLLNNARNSSLQVGKNRMYSEAITNIQTGQMWAVKAATWEHD